MDGLTDNELAEVQERIIRKRTPAWWHTHGIAVVVQESRPGYLRLGSYCTLLEISRQRDHWRLEWSIRPGPDPETYGHRGLYDAEMRQAFNLNKAPGSTLLVQPGSFLADAYAPGRFIRSGLYLNIPGPGCNEDWDPNLSLYLTDAIRTAITQLLASA
jgi:hypothetical protein